MWWWWGNERVGASERGWWAEGGYSRRAAVCRVTRWACEYASRQCKIIYGFCWRNRHRSAPARSGYGHHVKSGSCDMPLRSAAGSAQVGRLWSVQDGAFVSTAGEELLRWPRSGRRAREGCLLACLVVVPRARMNNTREWNGLEQAIDDVSHAEQVVGVRRTTQPREERRAALM